MPSMWNIQWNNANSQRAYPLTDWGTKIDKTGTIKLPDDFVLGLMFPVTATLDIEPDRFFIRGLNIFATGYELSLGYDDDSDDGVLVATLHFDAAEHTESKVYRLPGVDDFAETVGDIVIGTLASVSRLPAGSYAFTRTATAIEVDAIRPGIRGIASIAIVNGQDRSSPLYGAIELVADQNMRLSVSTDDDGTQRILISAISGEGLNESCVCAESEVVGEPIRFINGIPPKPDGNFPLLGDDCIEISPVQNGVKIEDLCSTPCCGSDEMRALVAQLQILADGISTMKAFIAELRAQQAQFNMTVLGSKLSDQGCSDC